MANDRYQRAPLRPRFGLRSLLLLVLFVALVAANRARALDFVLHFLIIAPVSALLTFVTAFWLVYALRGTSPGGFSPRLSSPWRWPLLGLASLPLAAALFALQRWRTGWQDAHWPRPFPYPDDLLVAIHDWWDRTHPAPPGYIKIHAEYYPVLFMIDTAVLLASALLGSVCGSLFRNVDFVAALRCAAAFLHRSARP